MKKIALFGGSFDPPHIGHQLVAAYVLGTEPIDEIWAVPTYKHALGKDLTEFSHRYRMTQHMMAIFGSNQDVSTVEHLLAGQPGFIDSRTINLVRHLTTHYSEHQFHWVMGSDLAEQSKTWEDWAEVEALAPPIVVGRIGYGQTKFMLPNLSSTAIKASIKAGASPDGLVPKTVAEYIREHNLYMR